MFSRLALGSGIMLAVLVAVLAYHSRLVDSLVAANRNLAAVTFRAARLSLELSRPLDRLDEDVRKLAVTGDRGYAERAVKERENVDARLRELRLLELSAVERTELDRFVALWSRCEVAGMDEPALVAVVGSPDMEPFLARVTGQIEELGDQAGVLGATSQDTISAQVLEAIQAGGRAQRVSLVVVVVALIASAVTVTATVRSITRPLRLLTEGTREVAAGRFGVRLAVKGPQELVGLAADFNAMASRLGELDDLKREFVSHASHELRTPLVAMQETNRLLLDGQPGPLTAKQRRLLELNLQGAQRLSRMISNLLELSQIEAGVLVCRMEPCDLGERAATAAAELEGLARERNVTIATRLSGAPIVAECDPDRVMQVIVNLLANAVRFSPPGGTVVVEVASHPTALDSVPAGKCAPLAAGAPVAVVSVADRGPGVPEEEQERVVERLRRLGERAGGGVGLGLAIASQLVQAHRGAIWVAPNPGGGSVFAFALPLAAGSGDGGGRA